MDGLPVMMDPPVAAEETDCKSRTAARPQQAGEGILGGGGRTITSSSSPRKRPMSPVVVPTTMEDGSSSTRTIENAATHVNATMKTTSNNRPSEPSFERGSTTAANDDAVASTMEQKNKTASSRITKPENGRSTMILRLK